MAVAKSSAAPRACASCGAELSRRKFKHSDARYCSDVCSWREYYARHGKRLRAKQNQRRRLAKIPTNQKPRPCRQCGALFTPKMDKGVFCSPKCCGRAMSVRNRDRENTRRRRVSAERRQRRMRPRECLECGVVFTPRRIKGRWCSRRCLLRTWGNIRRAQRRRVPYELVSPRTVFERDGWTCQLCGGPTPQHLLGTRSSLRPTVDHIVPLSKGGAHVYRNVQCAHLSCNLKKGARMIGQPRPF